MAKKIPFTWEKYEQALEIHPSLRIDQVFSFDHMTASELRDLQGVVQRTATIATVTLTQLSAFNNFLLAQLGPARTQIH